VTRILRIGMAKHHVLHKYDGVLRLHHDGHGGVTRLTGVGSDHDNCHDTGMGESVASHISLLTYHIAVEIQILFYCLHSNCATRNPDSLKMLNPIQAMKPSAARALAQMP
jgi:hypothetical protein